MLSKIATVTLFTAVAASYDAVAATTTVAAVNGYQAGTTTTVALADTKPVVYYYADYDNIVAVSDAGIYYQSALTPEAIERTHGAPAWSKPAKTAAKGLVDAKGVTFCGDQGAAMGDNQWGGKYKQVFVADAGDEGMNNGAVYGWNVKEDPANPAAVVLDGKWTVYQPDKAAPVDVECGPNNGLFIADKYNNAINWVTYDNLVAKKANPKYAAVVPAECGVAVDEVRSLAYDAEKATLYWTNNVAEPANAGLFAYSGVAADASPKAAACVAEKCNAWSSECAAKIQQKAAGEMGKQQWAVANAWDQVQVSKGDAKLYEGKEVVAEVAQEATYADAAQDAKRDVVIVADEKAGEVYVAPNGQDAKKIGDVADVYGVAYNDAYGWNGVADGASATLSLAFGAVLAVAALLL